MRKFSTIASIGIAVAISSTAALAQAVGTANPGEMNALLSAQPPAEFRVTREIPAGPLAAAEPKVTMAPSETMTAPQGPGSGAEIQFAATPDTSFAVSGPPAGSVDASPSGGFSTASGDDQPAGIQPMLGFNTTSSLASTFTPDASMTPNVTLGR